MYKKTILLFCFIFSLFFLNAHPGIGIVMDSQGNIYYTDLSHVWKISSKGEKTIAVRNVHTHELFLDEDDNLYGEHEWYEGEVTDKWGNYVWCLGNDGVFEKTIQDVEGFLENNTLVRDNNNNNYWAEKSGDYDYLKKQTTNGQIFLVTEHSFDDIRWIYFSKDNTCLYVVDQLKIKKVSLNGEVRLIAEDLKDPTVSFNDVADRHYIFGIWTDRNKNIYAAVYGAKKVIKINTNGERTTVFESDTAWSPCGGLYAPDGSQWIMEFSTDNKTRVRKIGVDGKDQVY